MSVIEELFRRSNGQSVEHNGSLIQMVDHFLLGKSQSIEVTFESTDSEWRQGIHLSAEGAFEVTGQVLKKSIVLWEDTAPKTVKIKVISKSGKVVIKNVWDTGDGIIQSWHAGAAMIVEKAQDQVLYRCNDGHPNEDFTDLVFSIRPAY